MQRVGTVEDTSPLLAALTCSYSPLPLHDEISSYMYTCRPFYLEMFVIDVWTYSTFSLDSSYNRVLSGLARDHIHPYSLT